MYRQYIVISLVKRRPHKIVHARVYYGKFPVYAFLGVQNLYNQGSAGPGNEASGFKYDLSVYLL